MNGKLLTILVGAALVLPVAYAAHGDEPMPFESGQRFGDCPNGWSCAQDPEGAPFPPDAVTGHTVYASWIMNRNRDQDNFDNDTLGLPTDFAAIAGFFAFADRQKIREEVAQAVQRECVVWFNGENLDQRPEDDRFGANNSFPSDEDEDLNATHQPAYQDYDFDRDVPTCEPEFENDGFVQQEIVAGHGAFAVAVEKGDCNPGSSSGQDFRYRGHLDFVDPNGVYHEVQEYDYVCRAPSVTAFGVNVPSEGLDANRAVANSVKDFFPWTYTDQHNEEGCQVWGHPGPAEVGGNGDIAGGDPGYFDLGHKCNGSFQDLFTERLWITPIHAPVHDETINREYTFALQLDTCAGVNIYEVDGKEAMGEDNDYEGSESLPDGTATAGLELYHEAAYHTYYNTGLDDHIGGWPIYDVCTDGSSFSFDDTPRGRVVHGGPPGSDGSGDGNDAEQYIMRGNSYDFDQDSDTFGKHRTNCRVQDMNWPMNQHPPGPNPIGDDCYPEDHKTAQVDIYVYNLDPTGQWDLHTKGDLTGPGATYTGPGTSTGPDGEPQEAPGIPDAPE